MHHCIQERFVTDVGARCHSERAGVQASEESETGEIRFSQRSRSDAVKGSVRDSPLRSRAQNGMPGKNASMKLGLLRQTEDNQEPRKRKAAPPFPTLPTTPHRTGGLTRRESPSILFLCGTEEAEVLRLRPVRLA